MILFGGSEIKSIPGIAKVMFGGREIWPFALPDGYTRLPYVQLSSLIDTGQKTTRDTIIEARVYPVNTTAAYLWYSDSSSSGSTNTTAYFSSSGNWRFGNRTGSIANANHAGKWNEFKQSREGVWCNGTQLLTYSSMSAFTSSANLRFGASSTNANPSGVQGICPDGWHVPSNAEWIQLGNYVTSQSGYACNNGNAKALASRMGWDWSSGTCYPGNNPTANNTTGFSALPAGMYAGRTYYFGKEARFWTTTTNSSSGTAYFYRISYNSTVLNSAVDFQDEGYSVRCVRN